MLCRRARTEARSKFGVYVSFFGRDLAGTGRGDVRRGGGDHLDRDPTGGGHLRSAGRLSLVFGSVAERPKRIESRNRRAVLVTEQSARFADGQDVTAATIADLLTCSQQDSCRGISRRVVEKYQLRFGMQPTASAERRNRAAESRCVKAPAQSAGTVLIRALPTAILLQQIPNVAYEADQRPLDHRLEEAIPLVNACT